MLNIALIGYGYWGPNIARNIFESKLTTLVSICDIKENRINLAKSKYLNQVKYTNDYKEYLSNPEIHAVAIAVETESHYQIAKEFILAGKHIFIEKPFTSTIEEGKELKELSKKFGNVVHVDHIMIFHPIIQKIKQMYVDGELGDLIYVDVSRMNLGKIKNDVSSMWDLAVHDLAIIDYLSDGAIPKHISAMGEKRYSNKETLTFLSIKYYDFIAHLKSSWISPVKDRRIIIAGTKKMVVFDDLQIEKLKIYDKGFDYQETNLNSEYANYAIKTREGDVLAPHIVQEDALKNSIEHFAQCVKNKTQSISGIDQALRVISILESADKTLLAE